MERNHNKKLHNSGHEKAQDTDLQDTPNPPESIQHTSNYRPDKARQRTNLVYDGACRQHSLFGNKCRYAGLDSRLVCTRNTIQQHESYNKQRNHRRPSDKNVKYQDYKSRKEIQTGHDIAFIYPVGQHAP